MINISKDLIATIRDSQGGSPLFIGVDGCGGAGKSTFAKELAGALGHSQIVHVDDFYRPKEQRIEITDSVPVHANFEFEKLKQQVFASHGEKPGSLRYVIVEGLGTLGEQLRDRFNFKIWVDSSEATRRERGIARDTAAWTTIWDNEYLPQDARYMKEQSPQDYADWVVSN